MLLTSVTALSLLSVGPLHAEEARYITDDLTTWARRGPGDNYRVAGTLKAGEAVTLLQTDDSTHYAQIRDSGGRTMWLPLKELSKTPGFRSRMPDLENQVSTLTAKLNSIENDWRQRTADMQQKVAQSDSVINGLKSENEKLKTDLIVARKQLSAANLQLDDKQRAIIMQWFLYGGSVLGVGLILGLVLPYLIPRRKRKDRWMN